MAVQAQRPRFSAWVWIIVVFMALFQRVGGERGADGVGCCWGEDFRGQPCASGAWGWATPGSRLPLVAWIGCREQHQPALGHGLGPIDIGLRAVAAVNIQVDNLPPEQSDCH